MDEPTPAHLDPPSSSLRAALLEELGLPSPDELTGQYRIWFDYAANSNQRGETLIASLDNYFPGTLRGKRVLDIGCGFGGTALAAGLRGASVTAVDLSERYIGLATRNLQDAPGLDVSLMLFDITRPDAIDRLGTFDLVIADNVVEHVRSPMLFMATASALMKPGGRFYLTAPNARSISMIRSECHYGLLGASLLSPHQATQLLRHVSGNAAADYEVSFYLDFNQYVQALGRYGLSANSLLPEVASGAEIEQLKADVARTAAELKSHEWAVMGDEIREAAMRWQDEFDADVLALGQDPRAYEPGGLASRMLRDYGTALWYFLSRKDAETPAEAPRMAPLEAPRMTLGRIVRGVLRRLPLGRKRA